MRKSTREGRGERLLRCIFFLGIDFFENIADCFNHIQQGLEVFINDGLGILNPEQMVITKTHKARIVDKSFVHHGADVTINQVDGAEDGFGVLVKLFIEKCPSLVPFTNRVGCFCKGAYNDGSQFSR